MSWENIYLHIIFWVFVAALVSVSVMAMFAIRNMLLGVC